jgi:hypothetical protein
MTLNRSGICAILFCFLVLALCAPSMAGTASIQGSVSMTLENGSMAPGSYLKLFLTTQKIDIKIPKNWASQKKPAAIDAMISLHINFYKQLHSNRTLKNFIASDADSDMDGLFSFTDLPQGDYYIVVTFPSMIEGRKVAWQVPVHVKNDKKTTVILNNGNLALPTYRRR